MRWIIAAFVVGSYGWVFFEWVSHGNWQPMVQFTCSLMIGQFLGSLCED